MGTDGRTAPKPEAAEERLVLEGRRVLRATGIREILRFDETAVVLRAGDRALIVRGEGLALRSLTPEEGRVEIRGRVDGLSYEQGGPEKGLLRRLFG